MRSKYLVPAALFTFQLATFASAQGLPPEPPEALRPSSFPEEIDNLDQWLYGFKSDVFNQWYGCAIGGRLVVWYRSERGDDNAPWEHIEREFTTSFWITSCAAREGGQEIFLAGMTAAGDSVIERWRMPQKKNRHFVSYGNPAPDVGTPQPVYCPSVSLEGGTFVGGLQSDFDVSPRRQVILDGQGGPWTALEADPEGRYLVAFDYASKTLVQISLGGDPVVQPIYTASSHPELSAVAHIDSRNFAGVRVLLLDSVMPGTSRSQGTFTVITDVSNDGVMDAMVHMNHTEFYASPYSQWGQWQEFWRECNQ